MNEKSSNERTSRHLCPVCSGPLRVTVGDGDLSGVHLCCEEPSCRLLDRTLGYAGSELASYGIAAATEDAAFAQLEAQIAAMPERQPPAAPDEDAGSWR